MSRSDFASAPTLLSKVFAALDAANVTREEAAEAAQVSVTAISQYRSDGPNQRWPSYPVFERLYRLAQLRNPTFMTMLPTTNKSAKITRHQGFQTAAHFAISSKQGRLVMCDAQASDRGGICGQLGEPHEPKRSIVRLFADATSTTTLQQVALILHPIQHGYVTGSKLASAIEEVYAAVADALQKSTLVVTYQPDTPFPITYRGALSPLVLPVGMKGGDVVDATHLPGRSRTLPESWERSSESGMSVEWELPRLESSCVMTVGVELPEVLGVEEGVQVRVSLVCFAVNETSLGAMPISESATPVLAEKEEPKTTKKKVTEAVKWMTGHSGPVHTIRTPRFCSAILSAIAIEMYAPNECDRGDYLHTITHLLTCKLGIETVPFATVVPMDRLIWKIPKSLIIKDQLGPLPLSSAYVREDAKAGLHFPEVAKADVTLEPRYVQSKGFPATWTFHMTYEKNETAMQQAAEAAGLQSGFVVQGGESES